MLRPFCRRGAEFKCIVRHMFSSIKDRPDMMIKDGEICFVAMKRTHGNSISISILIVAEMGAL